MSKNVNSGLTGKQWKFIEALANPEEGRTQAQMAIDLDIRPETLSRWKRAPEVIQAVYDLALRQVGGDLGRVLQAMVQQAVMGSVQAARLIFEITGKVKSGGAQTIINGQLKVEKESVGEVFTDDELRRIANSLVTRENQEDSGSSPSQSESAILQ